MEVNLCDLEKTLCKECRFIGEYDDVKDRKKEYIISMLGWFRENSIIITRKSITYTIDIRTMVNKKEIKIVSDKKCSIMEMYYHTMEILRFENLFDGIFFNVKSFVADDIEYVEYIREVQLSYYTSEKRYLNFPLEFTNREYKKYYNKWLKIEKKNKIIHPVFLFSTYLNGMTTDLRMALLLEIFEPIAEALHERGDIVLVKPPYKEFSNKCKKCGSTVSRKVPNKELTFADKIKPLIKKYGKEIFVKENTKNLVSKAVKVRNKVDHVKANTVNVMNGKQCGFYIYKFSLMYRYIMLIELGLNDKLIEQTISSWIEAFDKNYSHLII